MMELFEAANGISMGASANGFLRFCPAAPCHVWFGGCDRGNAFCFPDWLSSPPFYIP